jgi:hypothetical protein
MKTDKIEIEGFIYRYEYRLAKSNELCLATTDPKKYCNGFYLYSSKDPGDGLAFVVTETDNLYWTKYITKK